MNKKTIKLSIIIALAIIVGIILCAIYRTNFDFFYIEHKQVEVPIGKQFETEDILNIVKEVTKNKKVAIQAKGDYSDNVLINIKDISSEEIESLNTKINEKYEIENKVEDLKVTDIPKTGIIDYIRVYIKPLVIACIIIAIYSCLYIVIYKRKH